MKVSSSGREARTAYVVKERYHLDEALMGKKKALSWNWWKSFVFSCRSGYLVGDPLVTVRKG